MRTSVSLNSELASYVSEVTSSAGDNNAEAIRDALRYGRKQADRADSLESEAERLRERIEELEAERDRLKTEKQRVLEQHEETTELLQYVEQQHAAEQQWREAGLLTRAKWHVVGMPTADSNV